VYLHVLIVLEIFLFHRDFLQPKDCYELPFRLILNRYLVSVAHVNIKLLCRVYGCPVRQRFRDSFAKSLSMLQASVASRSELN